MPLIDGLVCNPPRLLLLECIFDDFSPRSGRSMKPSVGNVLYGAILLPMFFAVAGSRWFAKIPVGPVFVLDITMLIAGLAFLVLVLRRHSIQHGISRPLLIVLFLFWGYATIRLFLGELSLTALRDYAPFLYSLYVLLIVAGFRLSKLELSHFFNQVMFLALFIHWGWMNFLYLERHFFSDEEWHLFGLISIRADFDGMLVGLLAAGLLFRALRQSGARRMMLVALAACIGLQAGLLGSTAAYLATVAMFLAAVILSAMRRDSGDQENNAFRVPILGLSAVAVVTGGAILFEGASLELVQIANTVASSGTFGFQNMNNGLDAERPTEVSGTAKARLDAWVALLAWLFAYPLRALLGVGFGVDYLREAGALIPLVGEAVSQTSEATRHPHNFVLHLSALLGAPFAIICVVLLLWIGVVAFLNVTRQGLTPLPFFGLLGISVISLFGVVFEAPFGAILIWGLIGVTLALGRDLRKPIAK